MEPLTAVCEVLECIEGPLTAVEESMFAYFSEDRIVGWFVAGYFANDVNELKDHSSPEQYEAIMNHYDLHCRG